MSDEADIPFEKIDRLAKLNPFMDGPAQFLVKAIVDTLRASPQWKLIFQSSIDGYRRMDYEYRNLPAMRVYCLQGSKTAESWFIDGNVTADIIWPANLRRRELQELPAMVCGALWNQFRATPFFEAVSKQVPGLNQLGKVTSFDNSLAFEWGDDLVPLTQFQINFRLDLRVWDEYLNSQDREKDTPFEKTIADLETIASTLQLLRDDNSVALSINDETNTPGGP